MRACRLVRERDEYGWLARRIIRELEHKRTRRWNDAAPWDTRKLASTGAEIASVQRMHRIYDKQLKEGVRSGSGRPLDTLFFTTGPQGHDSRTIAHHALLACRTSSPQEADLATTGKSTLQRQTYRHSAPSTSLPPIQNRLPASPNLTIPSTLRKLTLRAVCCPPPFLLPKRSSHRLSASLVRFTSG